MAITVDDVPWSGRVPAGDRIVQHTRRMIAALRKYDAPVAVFVNCRSDPTSLQVLREWRRAGATFGNHTTGHHDLHTTSAAAWVDAVTDCHNFLVRFGVPLRDFRFPALHQGVTTAQRDTADAVLQRLRYRNAPVSIDNSDFLLAAAYEEAVRRGDGALRDTIGRLMLEHDSLAVVHYRAIARRAVGREVAHILLLHANSMTADRLDALLGMLRGMGARFITLDGALQDPIYAMSDQYRGPKGLSWLYRIRAGTPGASWATPSWDDAEAERLKRRIRELEVAPGP